MKQGEYLIAGGREKKNGKNWPQTGLKQKRFQIRYEEGDLAGRYYKKN